MPEDSYSETPSEKRFADEICRSCYSLQLAQSEPGHRPPGPSANECRPGFARLHRSLRGRPPAATSGACYFFSQDLITAS